MLGSVALACFLLVNYDAGATYAEQNLLGLDDNSANIAYQFNKFMSEYKKSYTNIQDFKDALANYKATDDSITRFSDDKANSNVRLGHNPFSAMSETAFKKLTKIKSFDKQSQSAETKNVTVSNDIRDVLGVINKQSGSNDSSRHLQSVPPSYDHRASGRISSVKD